MFIMPIGLANIGWKMYMVNGGWDVITLALIVSDTNPPLQSSRLRMSQAVFWVETKGKTLEEIDALFEGEKHSSVPDVEMIQRGKEQIDVEEIEQQLKEKV